MPLLVFEFFGTTEMLVIALVALIIFGPRKLPELGRSLGKSIGEFKRASEDFKRTWEREVEVERIERDLRTEREVEAVTPAPALLADDGAAAIAGEVGGTEQSIARTSPRPAAPATEPAEANPQPPAGKTDWL